MRYCKSTIFQANHNIRVRGHKLCSVVCDTAKVRFFKQITTLPPLFESVYCCLRYCKSTIFQANHNMSTRYILIIMLFAILQKYDFSSKSQHIPPTILVLGVVCDTAKVRFFKQITTYLKSLIFVRRLFAILQKYDFSSKSQRDTFNLSRSYSCLRYCKSTIFQANHNQRPHVRYNCWLFAILQKYDFSSKSQQKSAEIDRKNSCLRYCKSTIFQANHNYSVWIHDEQIVVCDTAKVRFFKQITTMHLSAR